MTCLLVLQVLSLPCQSNALLIYALIYVFIKLVCSLQGPNRLEVGGCQVVCFYHNHDAINTADVNQSEFGCLLVFAAF